MEKAREFQKNIFFTDYTKDFVWITTNYGKFLKRWEYQITLPVSCIKAKKQQLVPDMEQQIGSKLGKEYIKAVYCHTAYLTYMQSTSWEMLGWMNHMLESRFPGEVSLTSDMQMTPPLWQKVKRNYRASWWRWKQRVEKAGLKLSIQKTKIMASGSITSWQIDMETMETMTDFIFLGSKITAIGDCSHEVFFHAPRKKSYDQPRKHIKKQRHYFADKSPSSQS